MTTPTASADIATTPPTPPTASISRPPRTTRRRPAPRRPEPTGPRTRTPGTATRTPAGEIGPHAPATNAECRQWDRLHFRTALSRRSQRSRRRAGTASRAAKNPPDPLDAQRLPDPQRHAASIVTAAAEVLSGHRPADHLARWTTPEMFEALARRAGLALRLLGTEPARARPRARCARTQITLSGNCEAAVLLDDGSRVRAAAALLIPHRGRWIMSTLEIG